MPSLITEQNVERHEFLLFVAEASDLGLPPGEIPSRLETTLGNGLPFELREVSAYVFEYRQQFGAMMLRVFND